MSLEEFRSKLLSRTEHGGGGGNQGTPHPPTYLTPGFLVGRGNSVEAVLQSLVREQYMHTAANTIL